MPGLPGKQGIALMRRENAVENIKQKYLQNMIKGISSKHLLSLFVSVLILSITGCALTKHIQNEQIRPVVPEENITRSDFSIIKGDDVIGRMAVVRLEKGDTLADVARHFGLGLNSVSAANPGVDIWAPGDGYRIVLPTSFILPDAPRKGIVINLAAMRLFQFKGDGTTLSTYPVGIGTIERPTPMGKTYVKSKMIRPTWNVPASIAEDHRKKGDPLPEKVPPGPLNPLGEYAMYLNKSGYLIHGTNKPASIGLKATNGCMRLYPEDIKKVFEGTPVNTPVNIIYQPYLVGQRAGVVYLEVHTPLENTGTADLEKMYAKLRRIEKKSGRELDWEKVKQALTEARGVPVPIFESVQGSAKKLKRPWKSCTPRDCTANLQCRNFGLRPGMSWPPT